MDNPGEILLLCRLCLVKDQVNIPIFEEQGDIRQIFLKISSCLPIKVSRDDQLPKKICDGCSNKLDLLYEFWNTSANAEKTLLSWLGQAGVKDADETINAVAQQIAKPAETQVKEETETLEDGHVNSQNQDNFEPQSFDEGTKDEDEAPPPKRARRSAAVKAQINITPESDDDDDLDSAEPMTKMEGESDESDGEEKDPSYAEVPGTSADDQAGPSGVGKDGAEAPLKTNSGNDSNEDETSLTKTVDQGLPKTENTDQVVQTPNVLLNVSDIEQTVNQGDGCSLMTESRDDVQNSKTDKIGTSDDSRVAPKDEDTDESPEGAAENSPAKGVRDKHEDKDQVQSRSMSKQVVGGNISKTSFQTLELVVRLEKIDVSSVTSIRKGDVTTSIEQNKYIDVSDLLAEGHKAEKYGGSDKNLTTLRHSASKQEEQSAAFAVTYLTAEASPCNENQHAEIHKKDQQFRSGGKRGSHVSLRKTARTKLQSRVSKAPRKLKVNMKKSIISSNRVKGFAKKVVKKSAAARRKQALYHEQNLFCEICGLKFKCFRRYWNHVHTVHAEHEFTCIVCDKNTFKKTGSLLHHTKLKHKDLDGKSLEDDGDPLLFCEVCGLGFRHIQSRVNHISQIHTDGYICCPYCTRSFSSLDNLLCHVKVHDQGKKTLFRCTVCYKKLYYLHMYVHHIQSHQNILTPKMCQCEICYMKINGISKYIRHLEQHLYNNPQYFCFICKSVFVSNKKLELHMRYLHREHFASHAYILHPRGSKVNMKNISNCYWCGKVLPSRYLKVHLRRHAKFISVATKKSVVCQICLKDVASVTFRKHFRQHLVKLKGFIKQKGQTGKISADSESQEKASISASASGAPKLEDQLKTVVSAKSKQSDSIKDDASSDKISEMKKVENPDGMGTEKNSVVEKADAGSNVTKNDNISVEQKAVKTSNVKEEDKSPDLSKTDLITDLKKPEKEIDLAKLKKTSNKTDLKKTDAETGLEIIDLTEDSEQIDKEPDSKKIETASKKIVGKSKSEIVEITSDSKKEGKTSDLKKLDKITDSKNTTKCSDSKKTGEIFDAKKSDNTASSGNESLKQPKKAKKSRFSSTAPLKIESPRTPVHKLPKNRNEPFGLRFEPPDGPPGVDMDGPPGVDSFPTFQKPVPPKFQGPVPPKFQGPVPPRFQGPMPPNFQGPMPPNFQGPMPPGVSMGPFNPTGSMDDGPMKNVGPMVPFNTMGSVGGPMGPMGNVGQMGPFNPMNPVDNSTVGPFNTMGPVGPMNQGMDMTMYPQQNPGMQCFQQFGNQFPQMQGGAEPYFNQGMNFMDSNQYYGDPAMGGYQQFTQYMSQWSGSQMAPSGDVVKKPKLLSKTSTVCSGCEKKFGTSKVLAVHELFCLKLVEQLSKLKLHECPVCGQMFTSLANIKQHMFQSHAQIFKEFNLISGKPATKVGKDECKSCKQVFKSKEELAAHELTHEFLASLKSDLEKVDVSNTLMGKNAAAGAKKESTKTTPTTKVRKSRFDQKTSISEPTKTSSQDTKSKPSTSTTRQKFTNQNKTEASNTSNKIDDLEQKLRETLKQTEEMEKAKTLEEMRSPSFKMKLEQQKKKLKINLLYYQKQKLEQEKQARSVAVKKADEELKRIQKELLESQKASVETVDLTQAETSRRRSRSPYAKRTGTRPDDRRKSRSRSRDRRHIRDLRRSPDIRRRSRSTSRDRQYPKDREGNLDVRRVNLRDPRTNREREQSPDRRGRVRSPISPRTRGRRSLSRERYARNVSAEIISQRLSPDRSRDIPMVRPHGDSRERFEFRPEANISATLDKARPLNIKPGEEMRVYKCTKCATLFTNYRDYIRHNDMHEDEEDDEENYLTQMHRPVSPNTTNIAYSSRSQTYTSHPDDGAKLEKSNPVVFRDYFSRSGDTDLPVEKEQNRFGSTSKWPLNDPRIRSNEGDRFRASVPEPSLSSRRRDVSPYRPERPTANIFPIQDMTKTTPLVTAYTHLQQKQQYTPSRIVRVKCRVCSQEFPSQEYLDYHACPGPF